MMTGVDGDDDDCGVDHDDDNDFDVDANVSHVDNGDDESGV